MPEFLADPAVEPVLFFVTREADPDLQRRLTAAGRVPCQLVAWNGLGSAPLAAYRFAKALRAAGVDVVHTHDMRANLLAALSKPWRRMPWLCHVHGWLGHTHRWLYRFYEAMDRHLIRYADHVMVGSYATLDEVQNAGAKAASVAWNAVPAPDALPAPVEMAQLRAELGLTANGVVFAILGRLHPGKGQDLFLNAVARLPKDVAWQAVVIGTGETEAELKAQADALGLQDRLRFSGYVDSTLPWIAASDVIVVPSRKESLPLTCLEGMAHAKAVVVSTAGDLPRVVRHGETGLVVPIDDVEALAAALTALLASAKLRATLGVAARAHILQHHCTRVLAGQMTATARSLWQR